MSLANVTNNSTFFEWSTLTNQIVIEVTRVIEGIYQTQGNVTILNNLTASPLGLNVHSGGIRTNFIEVGPGSSNYPAITHKGSGNSNSGIYFSAPNTMHLVTASNVNITLAPSGNVGLGTTSPTHKLDVLGQGNITGNFAVTGNVGINKLNPTIALDVVGDAYITGNLSYLSDESVKQDITPIINALSIVNNLQGVRYKKRPTLHSQIGLVAQQVQPFLPEVIVEHDNKLGVNYPVMVALLIEAVKELKLEIEELKTNGS